MAVIAGEEWLAALVEIGDSTPPTSGVSGSISVTVEGSPAGKVGWTETVQDGQTIEATEVAQKSADVALIAKFPEYVVMLEGGSDPAVMFMQGRLKLSGDMGMFLALLPAMLSSASSDGRSRLAALTDR